MPPSTCQHLPPPPRQAPGPEGEPRLPVLALAPIGVQDLLGRDALEAVRSALDVHPALLRRTSPPPPAPPSSPARRLFDPDADLEEVITRRMARRRAVVIAASTLSGTVVVLAAVAGIT